MQGTPFFDVKYLHSSVHFAFLVICFLCFFAQKVILNVLFNSKLFIPFYWDYITLSYIYKDIIVAPRLELF